MLERAHMSGTGNGVVMLNEVRKSNELDVRGDV